MIRGVASLALLLALACGTGTEGSNAGTEAARGGLEVRDAWVEPPAAGRGPGGGFLTLANGSERARRLTGASSPAAGRIEIHRSWIADGVARMERVDQLRVEPGETLRLEPGGLHLMLFDAPGLAAADEVPLRLEFADGERRTVTAHVRPAGSAPRDGGSGHSGAGPEAERGSPAHEH